MNRAESPSVRAAKAAVGQSRPSALLALVGVIALLTGACGGTSPSTAPSDSASVSAPATNSPPSTEPTAAAVQGGPLKVWLGGILAKATPGTPYREWLDETVAQFEAKYPGTKIETTLMDPIGDKQVAAFRASFGAGEGPDVAMMYPGGFVTTFESSLLDLRKVAPDLPGQFPPGALQFGCKNEDCSNNPNLLAPQTWDGWVLAYNKEIFAKVGIAAPIPSWDEFLSAGEKLKTAGYVPFQMGNRDGYIANAYLANMYTSFITPEDIPLILGGKLRMTDPKLVEPLRLWAELFAKGYVNEDACTLEGNASQQDFIAGKTGTVSTYQYASLYKVMGQDKFGIMPWPAINGSPNAGAAAQVGQGWTITKFSTNVPLASAFVTFVTNPERQGRQFQLGLNPPANVHADLSLAPDAASAQASKTWLESKLPGLDALMPLETQSSYYKETAQALCGTKSPEAASEAIQAVLDKEIAAP